MSIKNDREKDTDAPIEQNDIDGIFVNNALHILSALDMETQSDCKIDYKTLYFKLFNGISLIIENTHAHEDTIEALKQLQCMSEDLYIELAENDGAAK